MAAFNVFIRRIGTNVLCSHYRFHLTRFLRVFSTSPKNVLTLYDRGVLQGIFPEESYPLLSTILTKSQTMYCGFDPTAESLHIGNLLAIIALLHFRQRGHNVIALIGGATALIGDPSGKDSERVPMNAEDVQKNTFKIKENIERVFHNFDVCLQTQERDRELPPLRFLNNMDWYRGQNIVDFLITVGRHFRMGPLLSRHSVQSRLNSTGLTFTEFTYQLFQAFDWHHLFQNYQCSIQIGGNDQIGNIRTGFDFITKFTKDPLFGLTVPLVTNTQGNKLGKSADNAVWLDPLKTSPFELYQYFINTADADAERLLKLFTFLTDQELSSILLKQSAEPENRPAQKALAEQVTLLVHGVSGLEEAKRWTQVLYGQSIEAVANLQPKELEQLFGQAANRELILEPGLTIMDVCMKAGCFRTVGDAERIIKAGGLSINYRKVNQPEFVLIRGEHILPNNITLLRVGKKNYYVVKWFL